MVQYRRNLVAGETYFFTVTLINRDSATLRQYIDVLRASVERVGLAQPFKIVAWVILPDHLHAVWTMPVDDCDYSSRWRAIKSNFVRHLKRQGLVIKMREDGSALLRQPR